ncbi:MAG: TonB-dependent receptor plug domain-containing protein [Brumimicrobium sp.]
MNTMYLPSSVLIKDVIVHLKERALRGKVLFKSFLCIFLLFNNLVISQQDPKKYQPVNIYGKLSELNPETEINRTEIEKLAPHDLGNLLQRVSGVSMRSYGGLGGMKTLSMRGLGGEHTKLLINDYPASNVQNGQTDFGLIQLDNIEKVSISLGNNQNHLTPISSQVMGSTIMLTTFENSFSHSKISGRASTTIGSFGQKEGFLALKKGGKSNFLSISGKYRDVDGSYPYQISMGDHTMDGTRRNNSFNEFFINLGGGIKWNGDTIKNRKHVLKLNAHVDASDKELPGAVILYNNTSDETLQTQNANVGANYTLLENKFRMRLFGVYNRRFLHYHDPSYFNQQGFLDNQYTTNSSTFGVNTTCKVNKFDFILGTDFEQSELKSNRESLGIPTRSTSNAMFKINYQTNYFEVNTALFNQFFIDKNRTISHEKYYNRLNPQFGIYSSEKLSKLFQFYAWYKHSLRPPSFNELYYSQIGNISLEPEETKQSNIGATFNKRMENTQLSFKWSGYYNLVDNKILALPTKNLFVWSITNVGKVEVLGTDFEMNLLHQFSTDLTVELNGNITYQTVEDISDRDSPTYKHQLAYTPKVSANSRLSAFYKNTSIHISSFYIGERYSLNQNNSANTLDPFLLFDTSLEYAFIFKKKHEIKVQAGVKNVFDKSYDFIRYFVMPGRNYFIKLSYELN